VVLVRRPVPTEATGLRGTVLPPAMCPARGRGLRAVRRCRVDDCSGRLDPSAKRTGQ
jgi:hypothetical protein